MFEKVHLHLTSTAATVPGRQSDIPGHKQQVGIYCGVYHAVRCVGHRDAKKQSMHLFLQG